MKKFKLSTSLASMLAVSVLSAPILSIHEASAMFSSPEFLATLQAKAAARASKSATLGSTASSSSVSTTPPPPMDDNDIPTPPPMDKGSLSSLGSGKPNTTALLAEIANFGKGKLKSAKAPVLGNPVKSPLTKKSSSTNHGLSGYQEEQNIIKKIISLANKAEIEAPVVDPAERAKLAQEKVELEKRLKDIEIQITDKRKVIIDAVEEVSKIALAKGKSSSDVEKYKKLMLTKGNDLKTSEVTTISVVSGVQGASLTQKKSRSLDGDNYRIGIRKTSC